MDDILDFSKPVDVAAFDRVVAALSSGVPDAIMRAQELLVAFKSHPDAYMRVDKLLTESTSTHTRFFALQVLEETILQRWNVLSDANKHAIRTFVMQLIVHECTSLAQMRERKALLTKMNSTLVSIAKREWPLRWPSFVQDVATSAGPQHPMVENSLHLLRLIAEEVFEFGSTTLTSRWVARKKRALADDFRYVMELCATVLLASDDVTSSSSNNNNDSNSSGVVDTQLQKAAMQTFCVYVPWMLPSLVFNAQVLERLSQLVVGDAHVRVVAVRCLAEVCLVERDVGAAGDAQARLLVSVVTAALQRIVASLPTAHSALMERVVQLYEDGDAAVDQAYVSALAELLTQFMKRYSAQVAYHDALLTVVHDLLIGMSNINDKELFKVCVEYWWWLGHLLIYAPASSAKHSLAVKLQRALSDVRFVLVRRMAKPEEVVLVEEDGELRREHMADVEELQLYALMRDALTFLTRLDYADTRSIMTTLMLRLLDRSEWSWHNCNVLSWSAGAIADAVQMEGNNELFYTIVRGLLRLCREMDTKADRAVIIGNVMFVVGQYPQFLREHPTFLFTVTQKLYDFMRETFPGVQDMAVDTLLKLARRTAASYVLRPPFKPARSSSSSSSSSSSVSAASSAATALIEANMSFAEASATRWTAITSMLSPQQVQTCFCAAGCMVAAEAPERQASLLRLFLYDTNVSFKQLTERAAAASAAAFCGDATLLAELLHYLRIFSSMASTCGDAFIHAMHEIVRDLYGYYRLLSQAQRDDVAARAQPSSSPSSSKPTVDADGNNNNNNNSRNGLSRQETAKQLRLCMRECLRVFAQFVTHTAHVEFVATQCLPEVLSVVLTDYAASPPATREPEALALVTSCVHTLGASLAGDCAAILDHTFAPTVAMLADSLESLPDFRVNLFKLLQALNEKCFDAYVRYAAAHEDVMGAMLWAITHTDYPTMSTALQTLDTFLRHVAASDYAEVFYTAYMERILVEVLVTAMDSLHAAGFALHCAILMKLFAVSAAVPSDAPVLGRAAVSAFLLRSLTVIPTLSEAAIGEFVAMCYSCYADEKAFRTRMADFLIEVRIWGAEQENRMQQQEEEQQQQQQQQQQEDNDDGKRANATTPPPRLCPAPSSRREMQQQQQQQQQQQWYDPTF